MQVDMIEEMGTYKLMQSLFDEWMNECDYMVAQGKWDQSMPNPMTSSGVLCCVVMNCDRVSSTHIKVLDNTEATKRKIESNLTIINW